MEMHSPQCYWTLVDSTVRDAASHYRFRSRDNIGWLAAVGTVDIEIMAAASTHNSHLYAADQATQPLKSRQPQHL